MAIRRAEALVAWVYENQTTDVVEASEGINKPEGSGTFQYFVAWKNAAGIQDRIYLDQEAFTKQLAAIIKLYS